MNSNQIWIIYISILSMVFLTFLSRSAGVRLFSFACVFSPFSHRIHTEHGILYILEQVNSITSPRFVNKIWCITTFRNNAHFLPIDSYLKLTNTYEMIFSWSWLKTDRLFWNEKKKFDTTMLATKLDTNIGSFAQIHTVWWETNTACNFVER